MIEHYRIDSILGEGGMGIVYKAFDVELERYVAVKVISPQSLKNPNFIARFKREAKNQAKLIHSNIVSVYGFTEDFSILGIVMEYVEGETLERKIIKKGRLDLGESLQILRQILLGAGYAHSKGFVHRDLKPSNIIISGEGTAKLMDFGISKSINETKEITRAGTKIGTILYMSPEQVKAYEPTNQSDIYSIGITFYEMLSGKTPFDYNTEFEVLEAHLKKNPDKLSSVIPSIPPEADAIISKALNKSLAKRYKDCNEFITDVDSLINKISGEKVKTQTKKKEKEKKPQKIKSAGNASSKIKFYGMAFIFIAVFAGLFYFVFTTVSQFWKNPGRVNQLSESILKPDYLNAQHYNWKKVNSPTFSNLNDIFFINDSVGFICGSQGTILRTANGGQNWVQVGDSSSINYNSIKFISPQKGFIAGEEGTVLETGNGGFTWNKIQSGVYESLFKIYFMQDNYTGFIVGAKGTVIKTADGGQSWQKISTPVNELLYGISFVNDLKGFAVGWNGTILKTIDKGNSWIQINKLTDQYLRDINFADDKTGIIAGGNGQILRSDNGGEDWNLISAKTSSGLFFVKMTDAGNGIILSGNGEILFTGDGGKSWKETASGYYVSLSAAAFSSSKKIFITGGNGTILTN